MLHHTEGERPRSRRKLDRFLLAACVFVLLLCFAKFVLQLQRVGEISHDYAFQVRYTCPKEDFLGFYYVPHPRVPGVCLVVDLDTRLVMRAVQQVPELDFFELAEVRDGCLVSPASGARDCFSARIEVESTAMFADALLALASLGLALLVVLLAFA